MASTPVPRQQMLLHTAETLAIAAVGGTLFAYFGMPAGLVMGSLLSVAVAGLAGRPVMLPAPLSRVISVLFGISLGAVVTPETLKGLATFPLSIAILAVATLSMLGATTLYLRFIHGWDALSALLGASPGGLAQVMALSAEYKADLRGIAIVQTVRVVALTVGIPMGLAFFGLTASAGVMTRFGQAAQSSPVELAILVAASTAAGLLLWWLRFPGGLLFGAMIASGVLHGTGWIGAVLPWWVVSAAVIGIGAMTGSRFSGTSPRTLLRFLGAALGSFAVAISIASLFVLILTSLQSLPIADVVVAFAPGAQDAMMVLALALHLDPVFVATLHLSRYILVSLLVPLLALRLQPGPAKPKRPPGAGRPTIED